MDTRSRSLRRRRRHYARSAWSNRVLRGLPLPRVIRLPGGRCLERHAHPFWRVRLPLWAVLGMSGWLIADWLGVVLGLVTAVVVEILFSFGRPHGRRPMSFSPPPPTQGGGSAGVREPGGLDQRAAPGQISY